MAEQKILAIFASAERMKQALDSLNQFGFTHDAISILMHRNEAVPPATEAQIRAYSGAATLTRPETTIHGPEIQAPPLAFSASPPYAQPLGIALNQPPHQTGWPVSAKSQSDFSAASVEQTEEASAKDEEALVAELADNDFAIKDPDALLKDAITGGGLGLIAGAAALLIPGVGPVIAAGPLAAAIAALATGAAVGTTAGALVGMFQDEGIPGDLIDTYYQAFEAGKGIMILKPQNSSDYNLMLNILERQQPEVLDLVA